MKVLFVAGEALPYIKTGGLADVMGSLPKELVKKGVDARVCIPLYKPIAEKYFETFKKEVSFDIYIGGYATMATIYSTINQGVKFYFVQHQGYFERDVCYGYPDDGERFSFFQLCVTEMFHYLDYFPDIIHENDWHTGMIPYLCHIKYGADKRYANTKHVFMIHNLAYQGNFPAETLSCFGLDQTDFYNGNLKMDGGISFLKAGVVYANRIMTVSNSYAQEITGAEYGERMDAMLRSRQDDLYGVVNGIDVEMWNPETDKCLVSNYNIKNFKEGKKKNKEALQKELGLQKDSNKMMIGMVSRLTWQKGCSIILKMIEEILNGNVQFVLIGNGEKETEDAFRRMENEHKGQAVYFNGYNEELAHRVYAGCDCFLMPSLFEPCGISQLIAMRYGCLPIVRETGGLKDTVMPYNQFTGEGTGFSFAKFDGQELLNTIEYAEQIYFDRHNDFEKLIKQAMQKDVSWEKSAQSYIDIYSNI